LAAAGIDEPRSLDLADVGASLEIGCFLFLLSE
jgi:hypothetical protein